MHAAAPLYAELAGVVLGPSRASDLERAGEFIVAMDTIMDRSGVSRRLRDVRVDVNYLPKLASDAIKQTRLLQNNPVEVSERDALLLYHQAY
jgi:alcohol dehydrogenase class IV